MIREYVNRPEDVRFSANMAKYPLQNSWESMNDSLTGFVPSSYYLWPVADIFGYAFVGRAEMYSPKVNLATLVAKLPEKNKDNYILWDGFKPRQNDGGAADNAKRITALLHNARALLTDWNFISADFHVRGENPVHHFTFTGEVEHGPSLDDFYRSSEGKFEHFTPNIAPQESAYLRSYQTGQLFFEPFGQVTFPGTYRNPDRPCHFAMADPYSGDNESVWPEGGTFQEWGGTTSRATQVQWVNEGEGGFTPTCIRWFHEDSFPKSNIQDYRGFQMELSIDWVFSSPSSVPVDSTFKASDFLQVVYTLTATRVFRYRKYEEDGPWQLVGGAGQPLTYSYTQDPYFTHSLGERDDESGVANMLRYSAKRDKQTRQSYQYLYDWSSVVDDNKRDLFASVVLSSEEAVTKALDGFEANHLESLTGLSEIRSFVTPLEGLVSLAKNVARGNALGTVGAALDLLADAKLLYSFGIAPSIDDAHEIQDRALPVLERFQRGDLFVYKTYSGKFTMNLPDDAIPPYSGATLVARSQVRTRVNPNSLLAAIMPLDAFGLFPTLSRIWELVPGSFVADWFLNIGGRLDHVDTTIKILMMDIQYSVHSVKLYWDIPNTTLGDYQLRSLGEDVPQLTYYVRTVMQKVPTFAMGDIDFDAGSGIPDWGTAASLMWKLFS